MTGVFGVVGCFMLMVVYGVLVGAGMVSSSYIVIWGSMEMGMILSLIYFLGSSVRVGPIFYYFIVQSMGSMMMLVGVITDVPLLTVFSILVKLGLMPVFTWVISVVWTMELGASIYLVLFLQKLVPLLLISRWAWVTGISGAGLVFWCSISVVLGSISMAYGQSFKWVLVTSSLVHTGWMVILLLMTSEVFVYYFCVYGGLLGIVLLFGALDVGTGVMSALSVFSSIPPLVGFLIKFFNLGLMGSNYILVVVAGVAFVVFSVVGYFINCMKAGMGVISSSFVEKSVSASAVFWVLGVVGVLFCSLFWLI
uniref:NADH dehydrogenase subunit 2 n=1 Tax=Plagiorhynchus transversus TaxID=1795586 RepID=A0A140E9N5_9BILA|nr:NADH dehydrogenase subunit 2 [Plagiorhynchus transversus]AMK97086.1 NADH dehydrogenase subunit 2 [Plagiorhynchus transversus]